MKTICLSEGTYLRLLAPFYACIVRIAFNISHDGVEVNEETNQKEQEHQLWNIVSIIYGVVISTCILRLCTGKSPDVEKLMNYRILFPLNLSVDLFIISVVCLSNSYVWLHDCMFNVNWFYIFHCYSLEVRYVRVIYSLLYSYTIILCKIYHFCLTSFKYLSGFTLIFVCFNFSIFIVREYEDASPTFMTNIRTCSFEPNIPCVLINNQTHLTKLVHSVTTNVKRKCFSNSPQDECEVGCQCSSRNIKSFYKVNNVISNSTKSCRSRPYSNIKSSKTLHFQPLHFKWYYQFGPIVKIVKMKGQSGLDLFHTTIRKKSKIPSIKKVVYTEFDKVKYSKHKFHQNKTTHDNISQQCFNKGLDLLQELYLNTSELNASKKIVFPSKIALSFFSKDRRNLIPICLYITTVIHFFPKRFDLFSYLRVLKLNHIPRPSRISEETTDILLVLVDNIFVSLLDYIRISYIGDFLNSSTNNVQCYMQYFNEHYIELKSVHFIALIATLFISLKKFLCILAKYNTLIPENSDTKIKEELYKKFNFKDEREYLTILNCEKDNDFVENILLHPVKATGVKVMSRNDFEIKYLGCTVYKMYDKLSKISKKYLIVTFNDYFQNGECTYHHLGILVLKGLQKKTIDKKDVIIIQRENIVTKSEYLRYLSDIKTIDFTKNSLVDNIEEIKKWALAENVNLDPERVTYTTYITL